MLDSCLHTSSSYELSVSFAGNECVHDLRQLYYFRGPPDVQPAPGGAHTGRPLLDLRRRGGLRGALLPGLHHRNQWQDRRLRSGRETVG